MTHILNDMEINAVKEEMCDSYCRMPHEAADQEELTELCKYCPMNRLEEGHEVIE